MKAFPSIKFLLFLVGGIFLQPYLHLSNLTLGILFILASIFSILFFSNRRLKFLKIFVPALFIIVGVSSSQINNSKLRKNHISNFKEIESYIVKVDAATEVKAKTYKTSAKVLAVKTRGKWSKATGKTLLYFNKETENYPSFGERYLLRGNIRPIEAPKNPYEFDYAGFQARKNIYSHHFIRKSDFTKLGVDSSFSIFYVANKLSQNTKIAFLKYLPNNKELGVAEALVAGLKSDLDFETKQAYSAAGAVHILAVSGMHVGILYAILAFIIGLFLNRNKAAFNILIISLLWIYALYTGLSPSVCRATFMFTIFQIGSLLNRDNNTINSLGFSALILLIINPLWIYDVGFQLSYLAVLGILIMYTPLKNMMDIQSKPLRWLYELTAVSFSAQLFTFPLSIYYFHQFPNYFFISNIFVAILAMIIMPLGLLLMMFWQVPYIGDTVGFLFKTAIKILNWVVFKVQSLDYSVTSGIVISTLTVVLLYLLIILYLRFFKTKKLLFLYTSLFLFIVLGSLKILKIFQQNYQKELTFHFIPNGEGISYISGRKAIFISNKNLQDDPMTYQYHLKNYYDNKGIKQFNKIINGDNENLLIEKDNVKIQWLRSEGNHQINNEYNYIICSNNVLKNLDSFNNFKGELIIDGSNKKWIVEKLGNEASLKKISFKVLYDKGSQTIKI